jgi:hypothetical protein
LGTQNTSAVALSDDTPCSTLEKCEFGLWCFATTLYAFAVYYSICGILALLAGPDGRTLYEWVLERWYRNMILQLPAWANTLGLFAAFAAALMRLHVRADPDIALACTCVVITVFGFGLFSTGALYGSFAGTSIYKGWHIMFVSWGFMPYPPSLSVPRNTHSEQ